MIERRCSRLTNEELVAEIQKGNNVNDNLKQLFNQCERLIIKTINHYFENGSRDDMLQESLIALWKAALNFDSSGSVKFTTFFYTYVNHACRAEMYRSRTMIHVPTNAYLIYVKWIRYRAAHSNESLTADKIKIDLKLSDEQFEILQRTIEAYDNISLQTEVNSDDSGDDLTLEGTLSDMDRVLKTDDVEADPEVANKIDAVIKYVLPERTQKIIYKKYWDNTSNTQIADNLHTSGHEVRKCLNDALDRLKDDPYIQKLKNKYDECGSMAFGGRVSRDYLLAKSTSTTEMVALKHIEYEDRIKRRKYQLEHDLLVLEGLTEEFRQHFEVTLTDVYGKLKLSQMVN